MRNGALRIQISTSGQAPRVLQGTKCQVTKPCHHLFPTMTAKFLEDLLMRNSALKEICPRLKVCVDIENSSIDQIRQVFSKCASGCRFERLRWFTAWKWDSHDHRNCPKYIRSLFSELRPTVYVIVNKRRRFSLMDPYSTKDACWDTDCETCSV